MVGLCAAEPSDAALLMSGLPPALLSGHEAQLREIFGVQRRRFAEAAEGRPMEWRSEIAPPREYLRRNACVADLVVAGRAPADVANPEFHVAPADVVMAVGRPVLIVPPGVSSLAGDHIVVAWKTGRAAALAVQLALPLLRRARRVTVLGLGEETSQGELDDVRDHLVRHQVAAETSWRGSSGLPIDAAIVEAVQDMGADLIVCGAYGRSHLFEWALGGATEGLLADSPVCCLMVH